MISSVCLCEELKAGCSLCGMQMAGWSPKELTFKALKSLVNPTVRGQGEGMEGGNVDVEFADCGSLGARFWLTWEERREKP